MTEIFKKMSSAESFTQHGKCQSLHREKRIQDCTMYSHHVCLLLDSTLLSGQILCALNCVYGHRGGWCVDEGARFCFQVGLRVAHIITRAFHFTREEWLSRLHAQVNHRECEKTNIRRNIKKTPKKQRFTYKNALRHTFVFVKGEFCKHNLVILLCKH